MQIPKNELGVPILTAELQQIFDENALHLINIEKLAPSLRAKIKELHSNPIGNDKERRN